MPEGCIEWLGWRTGAGYGVTRDHKLAHRVAYEKANGPIPDGLFVLHHCDNPPCTNVEHLFLGTQQDNMRDAANKGRMREQFEQGSVSPRRRVTDEQIDAIRADYQYRTKGHTLADVAARHGIDLTTVHLVVRRKYPYETRGT